MDESRYKQYKAISEAIHYSHGQGNAIAEEMVTTDKIKAMPMAGAMGTAMCGYGKGQGCD